MARRADIDKLSYRREDLLAMEPKPVANGEDAVPMEVDIDVNGSRSRSPSMANTGTERDELEDAHESDAGSASETASGAGGSKRGKSTSVSRQKLLLAKQVQRDAEAAVREAQSAKDREGAKAKRQEGKATAEEKRRLQEEQERLYGSLEELDREFRRQYYYPRMSPIGQDRFGNRFWWFDGVGSASLSDALGGVIYGTGRVYVQGGSTRELEARAEESEMDLDELREKRSIEETAEGFLNEGEWAVYETPEQVRFEIAVGQVEVISLSVSLPSPQFQQLVKWLHIRGREEKRLLETLTKWSRFIEGGMKRRIDVFDLVRHEFCYQTLVSCVFDLTQTLMSRFTLIFSSFLNALIDSQEAPIVGEDGRRARRPVGAPKETFKGRNAYLNYKVSSATYTLCLSSPRNAETLFVHHLVLLHPTFLSGYIITLLRIHIRNKRKTSGNGIFAAQRVELRTTKVTSGMCRVFKHQLIDCIILG